MLRDGTKLPIGRYIGYQWRDFRNDRVIRTKVYSTFILGAAQSPDHGGCAFSFTSILFQMLSGSQEQNIFPVCRSPPCFTELLIQYAKHLEDNKNA